MKIKKRKKESRSHGKNMGTHGGGARKKRKGSGHRGGVGMSGSGKRADHKKSLVLKKYGHKYFGKSGFTSIGTKRDTRQRINLRQIEENLENYGNKKGDGYEVNLKGYKILGSGEVKNKLIITCQEVSKGALDKIKKAGGEVILPKASKVVGKKE